MLILVSGGAASGKSEYAEGLILQSGLTERLYVATMEVCDQESVRRVERHRALRAGKGFRTAECPRGLEELPPPGGGAVLLECLSNLTANECFGPRGFAGAAERILRGVRRLASGAELTVVVTNELFSDGVRYQEQVRQYLETLAAVNRALAAEADRVVEVVCGIPVDWKGAGR